MESGVSSISRNGWTLFGVGKGHQEGPEANVKIFMKNRGTNEITGISPQRTQRKKIGL